MAAASASAVSVRDDVPIERIAAAQWDRLINSSPLLCHAFLSALHATGCASRETGWQPRYLTAWDRQTLVGALPLYAKTHSYGEYVFDWAWADAYHRHRRRYYPKLVAAIPFTPTTGSRLIAPDNAVRAALLGAAQDMLKSDAYSSLHILFPTAEEAAWCETKGMILRHGLQFHWSNPGYCDFDDFLGTLNHDKRKKIKQERRKLATAGVSFLRKTGHEISLADWQFFYRCYERTYAAHHSTPYLSPEFFARIGATMPDNLLLVLAMRDGQPIAAAFDIFDANTLWGRYWGAIDYVPGMHFEACYYQAIEFCIARGIRSFEGGAQGVHKLARGLLPVTTYSVHAIADPDFADAIARFCAREQIDVAHSIDELEASGPFKQVPPGI